MDVRGDVSRGGHGFKDIGVSFFWSTSMGRLRCQEGGGAVVKGHELREKNCRYPQCVFSDGIRKPTRSPF